VAQRALSLDDDDVRVLALERRDDLGLDLARAELGNECVQGDAVLATQHDRGLARADEDGPDSSLVQGADEQGGGGALPDRAVRTEHRDPRAGDVEDAPGEEPEVLLVPGATYVGDGHAVQEGGRHELGVVVEEVVEPVDHVHAPGDAVEQHHALRR
jgi:hypothetical protein